MTTTVVKERPILFSALMVKALLEGRKTQTRRIVKPQPPASHRETCDCDRCKTFRPEWRWYHHAPCSVSKRKAQPVMVKCPYGKPGDRLWVKETFCAFDMGRVHYRADFAPDKEKPSVWKSSIFMPRWASRITLEITDVRVQRVEEISEQDALGEGVRRATESEQKAAGYSIPRTDANLFTVDGTFISISPRHVFLNLFYDINKRAPRGENPWVWALTFKVVT